MSTESFGIGHGKASGIIITHIPAEEKKEETKIESISDNKKKRKQNDKEREADQSN